MSWLFSQALVAEFSAATCLDGEPSAQLSVMPTQHKFWRNDKMMEHSNLSRFGLTCAVLTEDHGEELLTSYLEVFHAKTSALPVADLELKDLEAASGRRWSGLLARYDLASCSWRTAQSSLLEGWDEFSETWPKWGSMHSGESFQRRPWVPLTSGKESGLQADPPLWRTPSASVVEPKSSVVKLTGRKPTDPQVGLADQVGSPLNPMWVEWLMGWPLGWTDLNPLEMDRFREWQQAHSPCFPVALPDDKYPRSA